jgi:hypothetical protein
MGMSGPVQAARLALEPTREYNRLSITRAGERPVPASAAAMSARNPMLGPFFFVPNATQGACRSPEEW